MTFSEIKQILSNKTVGIAGCGGLGSNSAVALARVGVGKLIIADFDIIVESNLNRQYYFYNQIGQKKCIALKENINKINPLCNVEAHDLILDESNIPKLFNCCDVVIEAFDKAEMKQMIAEVFIKNFNNKYLIMGSGLAGWGDFEKIKINKTDNIFICGDNINEASDNLPPLAPRVGIVSNMQANLTLDILLNTYGSNTK